MNLPGYSGASGVQFIQPTQATGGPAGSPASVPSNGAPAAVIDGTPVRVVVLAFAAAAGLVALKWAGFRFNVGVSN